ncbi:MAG: DUF763 domain-containing protein [Candidatus Diapherotrites archaeon]
MVARATADLPLHPGKCPKWLFWRMKELSGAIAEIIVFEYGEREFLERISNPFFFQALGCVIGFDFHSSGLTTTTCGALTEALRERELGVMPAGGKGSASKKTPAQIKQKGIQLNFPENKILELIQASKLSAKVDSCLVQDSFNLYHHSFFFSEKGDWAVIQQGLNPESSYARRYHWNSNYVEEFDFEPHTAICCNLKKEQTLNLTAKESQENKKISLDLAREPTQKLRKEFNSIVTGEQRNLFNWNSEKKEKYLFMPRSVNWSALEEAYEIQPKNFSELILIKGLSAKTVRALSLISELVYGEEASWKDPVKYSFCVGGKDGVPFFIDRRFYDGTIELIEDAVKQTKLGDHEKMEAIKRMKQFWQE